MAMNVCPGCKEVVLNLRLVFKRILFIFICLFSISPYSYGKDLNELKVKLIIEHFWDHSYIDEHNDEKSVHPKDTRITNNTGTTNFIAIFDGRLHKESDFEGGPSGMQETYIDGQPAIADVSYGIFGNYNSGINRYEHLRDVLHFDKLLHGGYRRVCHKNVSDLSYDGREQIEYKYSSAHYEPYTNLQVKFINKKTAKYEIYLHAPPFSKCSYKYASTSHTVDNYGGPRAETSTDGSDGPFSVSDIAPCIFRSDDNPYNYGLLKGEYNPEEGIIKGSKKWTYDKTGQKGGCGYTRATYYIGTEPPSVTIEPKDRKEYEEWLPAGGRDSNVLGFIVKSGSKAHFELELIGVSQEKGICLNNPNPYLGLGNADKSFDLRFDPKDNPHLIIDPSGQKAVSKDESESLEVAVRSEDYGSFGAIKADAIFNKGKPSEFRFPAIYDKENRSFNMIHIPDDCNNNKIADVWERKEGVSGYAFDWDEDPEPAGQKRSGDGFSLYEEYRGFYVKGKHQRLEPNTKELFIYDPNGIAQGSFFEKASGLKVYYINLEEMSGAGSYTDNKRWMNFNADSFSVSPQYGLHVVRVGGIEYIDEKQEDVRTGTTIIEEGDTGESPKHAMLIKIYPDGIDNVLGYLRQKYAPEIRSSLKEWKEKGKIDDIELYLKNNVITDYIKFVTTHELGHAVGVEHHKHAGFLPFSVEPADPRAAGDIKCVMRYLSSEYKDSTTEEHKYFLNQTLTFILNPEVRPDTFCKENDNCFGQINVKD